MKQIDLGPRTATFRYFKDFDNPYFNLCGTLDSTVLTRELKQADTGFSIPLLFLALKAANSLPVFRQRILGKKAVEYDVVHGGSTLLLSDQSFTFSYFDFVDDFALFSEKTRSQFEQTKHISNTFEPHDERQDLIHFSMIPWFAFTSISHARNWKTEDTVPKITFGKNTEHGMRYQIPISVEVHHALVDGYHVGEFLSALQDLMMDPKSCS